MGEWKITAADPAAGAHLGAGWSGDTEGSGPIRHRWSIDSTAMITVPVSAAAVRGSMVLEGVPYLVPGRVTHQEVWVFADGVMAAFGRLSAAGAISGAIPETVLKAMPRSVALSVVIPGAVVPAELGVGQDQRRLGFALQSLTVTW
jgi:hypothetical protein